QLAHCRDAGWCPPRYEDRILPKSGREIRCRKASVRSSVGSCGIKNWGDQLERSGAQEIFNRVTLPRSCSSARARPEICLTHPITLRSSYIMLKRFIPAGWSWMGMVQRLEAGVASVTAAAPIDSSQIGWYSFRLLPGIPHAVSDLSTTR